MKKTMDQKSDQEYIKDILNSLKILIESKPYNKFHMVKFKNIIKLIYDLPNKDLFRLCYNNQGFDIIYLICKHNKEHLLRYFLYKSHILCYFTLENKILETKYREDTLYCAMCSNQFKIVEMLYDHWTGDLHWLGHRKNYNDFDVVNLNEIHNLLKTALGKYESWILSKIDKNIDQTLMFNIQSLIAFSEFQRDLYTKLNKLKENLNTLEGKPEVFIRIKETEALRDMILCMFDCYEDHINKLGSRILNSVYNKPSEFSDFNKFMEEPNTGELLSKSFLYVQFEVYFRKLDYNICLLILDNLHSLKLRLTMPNDSYQRLESKIYHFLYHLSSKWSLYIPNKKKLTTIILPGQHNNIDCLFSVKYNKNIFERGLHIMYLERRDFESVLYVFKEELKNVIIEENIRKDKSKLPNDEVNSLTLLPELRDVYSLRRISQNISKLPSKEVANTKKYMCLLVERTLQIVGEFLKCTDETLHIQPTTEVLVEVEISVEIVNDLKILRDFFCHAKNGELLKRIEIETNDNAIFDEILKELIFIKKKIDAVIMICQPFVEKTLILHGLSLINKRRNEMPVEVAKDWFDRVKRVRLLPKNEPYFELFWATKGYADEYAKEIIMLVEHYLQLHSKLSLVAESINTNLLQKFAIYKNTINNSLQKIIKVKNNWQQIVQYLKLQLPSVNLLDYPNENDSNIIRTYSKRLKDDLKLFVEDNKLFAYAEIHWKFIKKLLEFLIFKTGTLHLSSVEINKITRELKTLSYRNNDIEKIINDYLVMIEEKLDSNPCMTFQTQCLEFVSIKTLRRKLSMVNFLCREEKNHLITALQNIQNKDPNINHNKIMTMVNKINKGDSIPKREYTTFLAAVNLDNKAQKYLMNLVMGYKRDPLHTWCLSKRIALLREITKQQCLDQLVTRYKLDKTFRVLLEVAVFDIFVILECTKNNEIVKKSGKLLTEINLRNLLIHGSPLLEILGNILDSNDFPTELITKALELVGEEKSIQALCALKNLDLDLNQIRKDGSLSQEQRALINEFKSSPRWKDYLIFIPQLKPTAPKKNITEIDQKLLVAVKGNDSALVQKIIAEGGNVNLEYDFDHALIHHVAIKGNLDTMRMLLDNGAYINIRSKYNMTALHYSAMNGSIGAVDLLLKNGADYRALNDRGQTPLDLAVQRNHGAVSQMLLQAMKK